MKSQDPLKPVCAWEVRRLIKVPALRHDADAMAVERILGPLTGVRSVAGDTTR